MKGWKYVGFISGIVGFIGVALYPIIIYPLQNIETYKEIQAKNRKDMIQEDIQPGNMKVWTDPFDRKK